MSEDKRFRRTGFYRRLFARYYDRFQAPYEEHIEARKRRLFAGVSGTVVEIGPGTGANLRYLPSDCRWIGVEPNLHMHGPLREKARQAGLEVDLRTAGAKGIDVDDAHPPGPFCARCSRAGGVEWVRPES